MDASMNGIVRATSTSGSGMWSANAVAFTFPATNIIHDIFADDSRHTMFVQSGVLYTITNVQSGLVLHLPEDDDKTIVASRPSPNSITKSRQLVRITCSFNNMNSQYSSGSHSSHMTTSGLSYQQKTRRPLDLKVT